VDVAVRGGRGGFLQGTTYMERGDWGETLCKGEKFRRGAEVLIEVGPWGKQFGKESKNPSGGVSR